MDEPRRVQRVWSNPGAELPINNAKYVTDCRELHLANRGITDLRGFDNFCNLESLWLNGNRALYLHDNRLGTLAGPIQGFKFLRTLTAHNNALKGLDDVLALLQRNAHLEYLDLSGNPVAEEPDYRPRVVAALPSLQVLDKHAVTAEERARAARAARHAQSPSRSAEQQRQQQRGVASDHAGHTHQQQLSGCALLLEREARRVHARRAREEQQQKLAMFTAPGGGGGAWRGGSASVRSDRLPEPAAHASARSAQAAWDASLLRDAFDEIDVERVGSLPRDRLRSVLDAMRGAGRVVTPASEAHVDRLIASVEASADGRITWQRWVKAVTDGVHPLSGPPVPPLAFERLAAEEERQCAATLFARSRRLLAAAVAAASPSQRQQLETQALRLAQRAGRAEAAAAVHSAATAANAAGGGGGDHARRPVLHAMHAPRVRPFAVEAASDPAFPWRSELTDLVRTVGGAQRHHRGRGAAARSQTHHGGRSLPGDTFVSLNWAAVVAVPPRGGASGNSQPLAQLRKQTRTLQHAACISVARGGSSGPGASHAPEQDRYAGPAPLGRAASADWLERLRASARAGVDGDDE